MKAWLFPGQGSQHRGMGTHLFEKYSKIIDDANTLLGYSIQELCELNLHNYLNRTLYTQPLLYVINALYYYEKIKTEQPAYYFAGHSLGEYNALLAANVFDFSTGLSLVKVRAELMDQANGGGMLAVIGLSSQELLDLLQANKLESIDIANVNAPKQIVISGPIADIKTTKTILKQQNVFATFLATSGAFHSRYMENAKLQFEKTLSSTKFNIPTHTVIANTDAQPYTHETTIVKLKEQLATPVKWVDTLKMLKDKGTIQFEQVGPGNVLSGLLRQNSLTYSH